MAPSGRWNLTLRAKPNELAYNIIMGSMRGGTSLGYGAQSAGCADGALNKPHAAITYGSNSYCYDLNGNQVKRILGGSVYTLSYDAENRLTAVSGPTTASFVYDADGKRVKATVTGVTTTYIGNYFEWTGSTSTMVKYYYAGGARLAMRVGTGTGTTGLSWLLIDHLGSTAVTADGSGNKVAELRYKGWGETRFSSGTTPTKRQYTGQVNETGLGLYFYNARWFDSYLNRWIQPDVMIPNPGNPIDLDRYAYARNNPVRFSDASGHCTGNPNDPKNSDKACWEKFNKIRKEFSNVFLLGRDWTKQQLGMIAKALRQTRNAFGDQQGFVNALGYFSIIKANLPGRFGVTPPGLDTIFLDKSTFSQKYENVLFTIVHEIGHIFDFKGSGGNPSFYKSQFFVNTYAPGCDTNYFGCVPNDPSKTDYPTILVQGNPGWNPIPSDTTPYGLHASIEDFADSFAVYVMEAGGLAPPWNVSVERKAIIALWIDLTN